MSQLSAEKKRKLHFQHTFSQEHISEWRRRSLIEDAKFESVMNEQFRLQQKHAMDEEKEEDKDEGQEDVNHVLVHSLIIRFAPRGQGKKCIPETLDETPENDENQTEPNQLNTPQEDLKELDEKCVNNGLVTLFQELKQYKYKLIHMETRQASNDRGLELLLQLDFAHLNDFDTLMEHITASDSLQLLHYKMEKEPIDDPVSGREHPWFPSHVSDLDKCTHLVLKFQPELATDHPGFHDLKYRQRRTEIAELAFHYRHGTPIPHVEYTDEENDTWKAAYTTLKKLYEENVCEEQIRGIRKLEKNGIFCEDKIPQLDDVSRFLKNCSGFRIRPVAGLLSARDFLASLAFRVFQATQYVRHHTKPLHTPEPDCIHELLGHIPMLCDREFAEFSQEIGLASLGASDEDISRLATLYWFTVEFGLCRQRGRLVALGAGLLSSYGEMQHALSDVPEHKEFDAVQASMTPYRDEDYQTIYYVAESVRDMKEKMSEFSKTIKRPFHVRYDPYTESIEVLNNRENVCHLVRLLRHELDNMERAMETLA